MMAKPIKAIATTIKYLSFGTVLNNSEVVAGKAIARKMAITFGFSHVPVTGK